MALWPKVESGEHQAVHALVRLLERQAKLAGLDIEAPPEREGRMVIDLRLPDEREEIVIEGKAVEVAPAVLPSET